jgi:hypothetical protein
MIATSLEESSWTSYSSFVEAKLNPAYLGSISTLSSHASLISLSFTYSTKFLDASK